MSKKEEEATARVMQIWPEALRDTVREMAGARAVTSFTLVAVQQRLDRIAAGLEVFPPEPEKSDDKKDGKAEEEAPALAPAAPAAREPEPAPVPAEPLPQEPEPEPVEEAEEPAEEVEQKLNTRGESIDVQSVSSTGVVAKFSSSASAVEDLMQRAASLGLKRGSELPTPVQTLPDEEPEPEVTPEPVVEAAQEVHVVEREEPVPDPEPAPEPVPEPRVVVQRNLDDIEVDF